MELHDAVIYGFPYKLRPKPKIASGMARLGVRDFEIHWISRGFRISDWIPVFHVDFWISKRNSGFQSEFLDNFQSGFWILFEELLFVILKMLVMNNDFFSAQMHTEYNVTGTS